ncbi:MAG: PAS domain S-box protein [Gammaproteobacteria bacterium]
MANGNVLARHRLPDRIQSGLLIAFTVTIFLTDILASYDLKIYLLYCIVIAIAPLQLKNLRTSTIAGLMTILIALGYFIPDIAGEPWPEAIRRLLTIITVWVIAYVIRNFNKYESLERSIIETDSNAIIVIDKLGKIEISNSAAENLLGYKSSEFVKHNIVDLLPDNTLLYTHRSVTDSKTLRPQMNRHQTELVQKHGDRIPVEISTNLFRYDADEYTTVIVRDLRSQKASESELQYEHDLNENIINTTRCIIVILDRKANIISSNPYLTEISGHNPEDIKGRNWFDIFIPEYDKSRILGIFNNAINGLDTDGTVNPINTADGGERVIIWSNTCLYDDDNNIIGVLCTGQDITNRQLEQETLLARTQQLVAFSEIAFQSLQEHDFPNLIRFILRYIINSTAPAQVIYCELADDNNLFHTWSISGKSYSSFRETTIPVVPDSLAHQALQQNRPVCIQDFPTCRQTRKITEINEPDFDSVLSVPVGADKTPVGALCVYHDQPYEFTETDINFLESVANILGIVIEKNRAKDKTALLLEERMKLSRINLIGELGSHIAHEINQPLTALMNYLESCKLLLIAENNHVSEPVANLMKKAMTEAERASSIIRNIRDYVETGQLNRTEENINKVIEDTCELMSSQLASRKITLTLELQADVPPVNLDKMQIQQVLINIINNSMDAMESSREKQIVITTSVEDGETVDVSIHDTGPGVIPAMLNTDFRVSVDTHKKGLGIGLPICQSIISAHGGKCWFSETVQGGATFNIIFPVHE